VRRRGAERVLVIFTLIHAYYKTTKIKQTKTTTTAKTHLTALMCNKTAMSFIK